MRRRRRARTAPANSPATASRPATVSAEAKPAVTTARHGRAPVRSLCGRLTPLLAERERRCSWWRGERIVVCVWRARGAVAHAINDDHLAMDDAVVGVLDDQLARASLLGAEMCDALGLLKRLAGDRPQIIGKCDLPVAVHAVMDADGWHLRASVVARAMKRERRRFSPPSGVGTTGRERGGAADSRGFDSCRLSGTTPGRSRSRRGVGRRSPAPDARSRARAAGRW